MAEGSAEPEAPALGDPLVEHVLSTPPEHGVEAIDDLTVDFVLNEPYGAMLGNLTPFLGIVPAGTSAGVG